VRGDGEISKYYALFVMTSFRSVDEARAKSPEALEAHISRSKEFHADGKVLMAGAFLDNSNEPLTTMAIFTSREDAEEYALNEDSYSARASFARLLFNSLSATVSRC
jgi:uncharacterized protein YciI